MSQWDEVSPEFARASLAADQLPPGSDRVRAHEAVLRRALSSGSFAEKFVARLDLTEALMHVPCSAQDLVHVHWLRQALDARPDLVEADRDAVLVRLRWAVDLVEDTPTMGLDALVSSIDDLERALRARGGHLGPVHAARARLAHARGDRRTAELELAQWVAVPPDIPGGGCPACEVVEQARFVRADDPDRALSLVTRVVTGELTCGEGAGRALALDADLRLDRGDVDGAITSFRRAWQPAREDAGDADTVGACLRLLLRLGNADRALDLLLPRLGVLQRLRTPREGMWFAATAAFVLRRAVDVGLAPAEVDGRPVTDVAAELARRAAEVATAFDARYASTVTSKELAAAHDPGLLAAEPTLPPTRLPSRTVATRAGEEAVPAATGVLERAALLREGLASLAGEVDVQTRAWLRDRESIVPVSTSEEWAAVSLLDRVSAQDAGDAARHRALLESALDAARRAGDIGGATRCEGELALLDVGERRRGDDVAEARSRARASAERLETSGEDTEAAGLWRRIAWLRGSPDARAAVEDLGRAAAAYSRAGLQDRSLLCTIEAATAGVAADPAEAAARLDAVAPEAAERPVLRAMVLEGRARLAVAAGDPDAAVTYLQAGVAVRRVPDHVRAGQLLLLGDLLVDGAAWQELEVPAADVVAAAVRSGDPVLLAHGQRMMGLAYAGTGRPVEAAELLTAAVPVLRRHGPALAGPTGWALGDVLVSSERWEEARAAFATASADFAADGRPQQAAYCCWQAGNAAWDAGDVQAADAHFAAAETAARSAGAVGLFVEVLRSRAALRVDTADLVGGLEGLDGAIPAGERLAAEVGAGDDEFDGEVLEPHVLRQGAHLLADHGMVDEAVERLGRAQALVGADLEIVLGAEAGAVLADHDRLAEAEPRLRASLAALQGAGLVDERVDAAGVLARALERAGRGEEAEEVWDRYGPTA